MRIHAATARAECGGPLRRLAQRNAVASSLFAGAFFRVALICHGLLTLFWLQFTTAFYFGLATRNVTGSLYLPSDPTYFVPLDTGLGLSLAWHFLILSACAAAFATAASWFITRRVAWRRRMRFFVCLFAAGPLGAAILNLLAEEPAWRAFAELREQRAAELRVEDDPVWRDFLIREIEIYDAFLRQRPDRR